MYARIPTPECALAAESRTPARLMNANASPSAGSAGDSIHRARGNAETSTRYHPESFPALRAPSVERPRWESRQRDSGRKRDHSKRGRSASRRRPSQSRERAAWADAVKVNMAEKRQTPAQNAEKKIQEMNGVVKALRDENEKLKRKIAEQDATIKEINEKLTTLIAKQQQQQQQLPKPAQERKQEKMTADEPEVEVDPRTTKAAGPAPKRRAIEGAKERKITERIEKEDDRLDHLEATSKVTNERLTALEQTVQQMTTNVQSTIQNMIAQMQAQLQAHIQAQMQSMEAQIIAKLQQSWTEQHVQQQPHSQALKNLNEAAIKTLTNFYNKCWQEGRLPKQWKAAKTILIPKPGRPPNIENLRPISLTSCVGKVLEHVLMNSYSEGNAITDDAKKIALLVSGLRSRTIEVLNGRCAPRKEVLLTRCRHRHGGGRWFPSLRDLKRRVRKTPPQVAKDGAFRSSLENELQQNEEVERNTSGGYLGKPCTEEMDCYSASTVGLTCDSTGEGEAGNCSCPEFAPIFLQGDTAGRFKCYKGAGSTPPGPFFCEDFSISMQSAKRIGRRV
ncbi:uncharacterized protein ISCGN_010395 [Ixodes scapularis]